MSEPFIGEIQAFGFNYAPRGWALCNGQLLPIAQNTALFSLLGTTYGGDGRTTFALPDLRGRVPLHFGQGPGLSNHQLGQRAGSETATLNTAQMPPHNHTSTSRASANPANTSDPTDNTLAMAPIYNDGAATVNLDDASTGGNTGSSQAHNNMPPYLTINFCIALTGIFPPRD